MRTGSRAFGFARSEQSIRGNAAGADAKAKTPWITDATRTPDLLSIRLTLAHTLRVEFWRRRDRLLSDLAQGELMRIAALSLFGFLWLTAVGVFAQGCPLEGSGGHNN